MKRTINLLLVLFLLVSMIFLHSSIWANTIIKENGSKIQGKIDRYIPGELVIKFNKTPKDDLFQLSEEVGARLVGRNDEDNYYLLRFADDQKAVLAMSYIKQKREVAAVFRNIIFSIPQPFDFDKEEKFVENGEAQTMSWTNDPSRGSQWHLARIKDDIGPNPVSPAPLIAVIDTGVDYDHVDLAGRVIKGYDFIDYDNDPMDVQGHGTHVAGIATATMNNRTGVAGVSPYSKILAVRVLDQNGGGSWFSIVSGITYARNYPGVKIINLSLGGWALPASDAYKEMRTIIQKAFNAGIIVACAAGNDDNILLYDYGYTYYPIPAAYPESFTVAATDENDFRTYFSNYSTKKLNFVDIAAPGLNILSTTLGDGYEAWSGTSMSSPVVAGVAARVWAKSPNLTNTQVQNLLKNRGVWLNESKGFPVAVKRIDLNSALMSVGQSSTRGIQGRVMDSLTGRPIKAVNIRVYKLPENKLVRTVSTLASGFFTVPNLSAATSYKVEANKTGYIQYSQSVKTPNAGYFEWANSYLVPNRKSTSTDQNWTIALDWNSGQPGYYEWLLNYKYGYSWMPKWQNTTGREMNSYLRMPDGNTIYWERSGTLSEYPYVRLTRDSWVDFVATEPIIIRKQQNGTYKFAVSLDPFDGCFGKFKGSGAIVRVYKGTSLKGQFRVSDATGNGTKWWYVFDLNGNTVTKQQKLRNTPPW